MGYHIDLESISIDNYKIKLANAYLPPSRLILKERIDVRFDYFKKLGVKNLKELIQFLKKKEKVKELSKIDFFAGDYLVILLRELNSLLPKPNKLKEFVGIKAETVSKLEKLGISDTLKLFDKITTPYKRKEFATQTGIKEAEILELAKLTDLSRIKWVGVSFARILFDLGIDSVEKVAKADPVNLHKQVNQYIRETNLYKGQIGLNDMKILVETAKEIPVELEF